MLRNRRLLTAGLLILAAAVTVGGVLAFQRFRTSGQGEGEAGPLPPTGRIYIPSPKTGSGDVGGFVTNWKEPNAVAVAGELIIVLDTGNGRVVVLNRDGETQKIIGERGPTLDLFKKPEALAVLGDRLYVANTEAGEVVVLNISGEVEKRISLPQEEGSLEPRPSGIAVLPTGAFYVADRANGAVLRYDENGELVGHIDSTGEEYTFNEPRGLTVDVFGDLYVADSGNGRVKKFSSEGRYLAEYLMPGSPTFSAPVAAAVGSDGTVYFSDAKKKLVQAFAHSGEYLGIVGLLFAGRVDSPSVLVEPAGLWMAGDMLYIADRSEGIFAFEVDPEYWVKVRAEKARIAFH